MVKKLPKSDLDQVKELNKKGEYKGKPGMSDEGYTNTAKWVKYRSNQPERGKGG